MPNVVVDDDDEEFEAERVVQQFRKIFRLTEGGGGCRGCWRRGNVQDCVKLLIFYDGKLFQARDNKASARRHRRFWRCQHSSGVLIEGLLYGGWLESVPYVKSSVCEWSIN